MDPEEAFLLPDLGTRLVSQGSLQCQPLETLSNMHTCISMYSKLPLFYFLLFGNYQFTSPESEISSKGKKFSLNFTKISLRQIPKSNHVIDITTENPSIIEGKQLDESTIAAEAAFSLPNSGLNNDDLSSLSDDEKGNTAVNPNTEDTTITFQAQTELNEERQDSSSSTSESSQPQESPNSNPVINDKSIETQKNIPDTEMGKIPIPTPVDDLKVDDTVTTNERTQSTENSTDVNHFMESDTTSSIIINPPSPDANHSSIDVVVAKEIITERPAESEEMPSFDEWKKKMLAEQQQIQGEKPIQLPSIPGKKQATQNSKRRRNYASSECGAKILASNSEAEAPNRILNEQMDMYMLNPCKAKIWFIIELCETIQATQFEMANFELFSSLPKHLTLQWSDHFPTREWTSLGAFTATDQRIVHSFNLKQHGYGKFLKVELNSYYGREHYCPLSLVRVYGTSMVDEYEEMEIGGIHLQHAVSEADDEEKLDSLDNDGSAPNIFGSAREVVLDIVRKAARALGREDPADNNVADLTTPDIRTKPNNKTKRKKKFPVISNGTTHALLAKSRFYSLGPLLDECGFCSETPDTLPCFHSLKCKFVLSVFNISAVANFCQTTACSLPELNPNTTIVRKISQHKPPLEKLQTIKPIEGLKTEQNVKGEVTEITTEIIKTNQSILSMDTIAETQSVEALEKQVDSLEEQHHHIQLNSTSKNQISITASEVTGTKIVHLTNKIPSLQSSLSETIPPVETPDITSETLLIMPTPVISTIDVSVTASISEEQRKQQQEFSSMTETLTLEDEEVAFTNLPTANPRTDTVPVIDGNIDMRPVTVYNVGANLPTGQKESVFMRLNNRIKILEMNMSLSSQYLQELSQRYRRQMEEMQRGFNRTVAALNDTAQHAAIKDVRQQESIKQLQLVVSNLTRSVRMLTDERESLYRQVLETHLFLLGAETILVICILTLCLRRMNYYNKYGYNSPVNIPQSECASENSMAVSIVTDNRFYPLKRHNSTTDVPTPLSPEKKRRPSEMVSTAGTYADLMIVEPAMPIYLQPPNKPRKKNRHRKNNRGGLMRSVSNPDLNVELRCQECCSKEGSSMMNSVDDLTMTSRSLSKGCENCCFYMPSLPTILSPASVPKVPLKNLTNGKISNEDGNKKQASSVAGKGSSQKETFSIRKLLQFQKRESV